LLAPLVTLDKANGCGALDAPRGRNLAVCHPCAVARDVVPDVHNGVAPHVVHDVTRDYKTRVEPGNRLLPPIGRRSGV
jgi:hypothetical protein